MGLFTDLVEKARVQPRATAPAATVTWPAPTYLNPALDLLAKGAGLVGGVLSISREMTSDKLSRGGASFTVGDQPPVITPEGTEREITAPELLMEGLAPDRRRGTRATSADYRAAANSSLGAAINQGALSALGATPSVLGAMGDLDLLVASNPKTARLAHLWEDVTRVPTELLAGVIPDPVSLLSGSAIARGLSPSVKARALGVSADRAMAKAGVALGTAGAVEGARKTVKAAGEGKTDEAIVGAVETLVSGGMAGLAHKGAKELKAAEKAVKAAIDTGPKYKYDPKLTAEERAAIEFGERASAEAEKRTALRREDEAALEVPPELRGRPPWDPEYAQAMEKAVGHKERADTRADEAMRAANVARVEEAAGVGEGHGAGIRVGERTLTLKDAEHHLSQLPKVGEELAGRFRAASEGHEVVAGRLQAADRQALAPLGDRVDPAVYEPIAQALDGKADPATLSPEQQAVYKGQRAVLNDAITVYNEARQSAGLDPVKVEADYWPRVKKGENLIEIEQRAMQRAQLRGIPLEDAMRELRGSDLIAAARTDRKGAFERERTGDLADPRYDAAVIPEYIEVLARRTSELLHYGKNGEALSRLIAQLPNEPTSVLGLKVGDHEFAQRFFDRVRNVAPAGVATQIGHMARSLTGAHDLVWATASQPMSYAQTASAAGVLPTVKGVMRTVGAEVKATDMIRPRQLAAKVRRSWRAAGLDAERVGAVGRHITDDLLESTAGTKGRIDAKPGTKLHAVQTVVSKVQRLSTKAPWIQAMLATDRMGRVAAVQTWREVGPKMIERAKLGDTTEQANLARMHIDWKGIDPSDAAAMDLAAKRFSDATQYRATAGNLPPWASSPLGRASFQYLSFIQQHTKTVKWMFNEAGKGNMKPLMRFAAVGIPIAVLSREFVDNLRAIGWDQEEVTADNVLRKMRESATGRARINPLKGPYAAAAYAARVGSMLGVGMVYEAMLGRMAGGDIYDVIPAGKYARGVADTVRTSSAATGAKLAAAGASESGELAAGAAAQQATEAAGEAFSEFAGSLVPPIPIADAVREVTAPIKPPRAMLAGHVRDWLEDKGIIPVSDESTRGVKGRENIAELKRLSESNRTDTATLNAMLAEKPKATIAEKLSKAEKSQIVLQLKIAYVQAVRANDTAAKQRVVAAFRSLRLPFSSRTRAGLEQRAIMPKEE